MFKFSDTEKFQIMTTISAMAEHRNGLPCMGLDIVKKPNTATFVVDMINGFVKEGTLADTRIGAIIPNIFRILDAAEKGQIVFLNDAHGEGSVEFSSYPPHCTKDSEEGKIVTELNKYAKNATVIEKNSTNGFMSPDFQSWLKVNEARVDNYIIVGDCTDICIKQFAMSLKAYFNEKNTVKRLIVPADAVETFHLDVTHHHAGLMNLLSLYEMEQGGIEIVKCME